MVNITNDMVHYAYEISKKVYAGSLGRQAGGIEVSRQSGMGVGSAQGYITVFLAMLEGNCYKRTINKYATEYYLKNIGIDFGKIKQHQAAQAALEHVKYYSEKHGYLKSVEDIARIYL